MAITKSYKPEQVKRMTVNPYAAGELYDTYGWLKDLVTREKFGINWNIFWRWVSFVYDPYSPMAEDYSDVSLRKREAAKETGFTLEHEKELKDFIISYLKVCKNQSWSLVCCNELVFEDYMDKVTMPVMGDTDEDVLKAVERQGKMLDLMKRMTETGADIRNKMFCNDKELLITEQQSYKPEDIVNEIRKNKTNNLRPL